MSIPKVEPAERTCGKTRYRKDRRLDGIRSCKSEEKGGRPLRHHSLTLLVAGIALVTLAVAPAFAGDSYSVYDWWMLQGWSAPGSGDLVTDSDDLNVNGAGYHGATGDLGTWQDGDALSNMRVEYAGYASQNSFGWYEYDGGSWGSGNIVLHEIFDGSATSGSSWTSVSDGWYGDHTYNRPDQWGFYIHTPEGDTWYSEWSLNSYESTTDDTAHRRHFEVFDHPVLSDAWVLCMEDLGANSWHGYDASDFETYNTSTNNPLFSWGRGHTGSSTNQEEPDFQDMILTFQRVEYQQGDWDNSPELGTWMLLLATAAFGGWLKRRRKED